MTHPITLSDIRYREELIEKYFMRQLSKKEQRDFTKFVKIDPSFRSQLKAKERFHNRLHRAITPSWNLLFRLGIVSLVISALMYWMWLPPAPEENPISQTPYAGDFSAISVDSDRDYYPPQAEASRSELRIQDSLAIERRYDEMHSSPGFGKNDSYDKRKEARAEGNSSSYNLKLSSIPDATSDDAIKVENSTSSDTTTKPIDSTLNIAPPKSNQEDTSKLFAQNKADGKNDNLKLDPNQQLSFEESMRRLKIFDQQFLKAPKNQSGIQTTVVSSAIPAPWIRIMRSAGFDARGARTLFDDKTNDIEEKLMKTHSLENLSTEFFIKDYPFKKYDLVLEIYVIADRFKKHPTQGARLHQQLQTVAKGLAENTRQLRSLDEILANLSLNNTSSNLKDPLANKLEEPGNTTPTQAENTMAKFVDEHTMWIRAQLHFLFREDAAGYQLLKRVMPDNNFLFPERYNLLRFYHP